MNTFSAADVAQVIEVLSTRLETFTANDVWDAIGHDVELVHPNATMGAGFNLARKRGLIRKTGQYIYASHKARKHGAVAVWESLNVSIAD